MRAYVYYSEWWKHYIKNIPAIPKIKKAVTRAGGTNVRTSYIHGDSTQPRVVTFDIFPPGMKNMTRNQIIDERIKTARRIEKEVMKELRIKWVIVIKKDW